MEGTTALSTHTSIAPAASETIKETTSPSDRSDERNIVSILAIEFSVVVATQKLAIPLGGPESQIPLALVIHYATIAFLLATGRARIAPMRLALLCAFSAVAILVHVSKPGGSFSVPSMALMLLTSSILVFVVPLRDTSYITLLRAFVALSVAASMLVVGDWLTQIAGLGMPNLDSVTPPALIYSEYVYLQPVQWDSPWLKPNGLFFLEASHVSQFIAMGLVVELAFFRRISVAIICAAAVFLSYGGTGLVILALASPFLVSRVRPSISISIAVITACLLIVLGSLGFLDAFINRAAEFSQNDSSAFNRFIFPAQRFVELLQSEPERLLLGDGAGTMPKAVNNLARHTFGLIWPPYTKVAVEYGIVAFGCWLLFLTVSMFGGSAPFIVAWIAFIQYQFLNGSLNVPVHLIYCWLLCAGYHISYGNGQNEGGMLPASLLLGARSRPTADRAAFN